MNETLSLPTRQWVLDSFGGPEVLRLEERATVAPGEGEVLVDVDVAGVNFGDTMIRRGEYLRNQPLSMAPGCEVVGRVAVAGARADVAEKTRVAGWVEAGGAYASRVIVPAHRVYPVPDDIPAGAIAAIFLQGITAEYAVNMYGRTAAGQFVLVHGAASGVGSLAVQLGKIGGARVLATASSEAKRELVREQGADVVLDSLDADGLTERVLKVTNGHGCDVVIDGIGGPLFIPSLKALAVHGRYVVVGSATQQPAMFDARRLLVRNQTVCGFIVANINELDPAEPGRALAHLCDLVRQGLLQPRYRSLPLEQAPAVHRLIEDRTLTGKVVLEP
jgi:NADPH2:quinone reductase